VYFGLSHQARVSTAIEAVSNALLKNFVPSYLGYEHLTRDQVLEQHTPPSVSKIAETGTNSIVIVLDGTYLQIDSPSDYETQRKTFSTHKGYNLVKPMMLVFPNGYILEAEGPFFGDTNNSDTKILDWMMDNSPELRAFFSVGDCFVLDRGFKNCIPRLESEGFKVMMPLFLEPKQKQFTTEQANISRQVCFYLLNKRHSH